ncbi:leucine-rich repeat-containing protein kinase family protein [Algibacter sp. AS12]|uniref:leucine-rich repeat-containing protein kinase family protein n=1 Tax=Algibacter sp. AS12 TaxID=3135773 RepID=UPI00398A6069
MTHTLEALQSGQLIGLKRLKLACGLKTFPEDILKLADTLEILDLSGNDLSILPDSFAQLKKLRILFFANNKFTVFPSVLARCPELSMIGFKFNQITTVPEDAFPPKLNWLILTDNKIKALPKSIGKANRLRKCALSGNKIEALPDEMANCVNLELLRISANHLKVIPNWLFKLPKLTWIAFGGNPVAQSMPCNNNLESYNWDHFSIKTLIGEGASGFISRARWEQKQEDVAIKVFKGAVTSDGLPEDEMDASIAAGNHKNLIPILGKIKNHPDGKSALIMELIASNYSNLGNPPSLETCTRDVFDETTGFTANQLLKIAKGMASVCGQLHEKGINHGDFYAHNILVNKTADCYLGDFGAASFYNVNGEIAPNIQRIEVRAYGCLLEDVLNVVSQDSFNEGQLNNWLKLINDCTKPDVIARPSFSEITEVLNTF